MLPIRARLIIPADKVPPNLSVWQLYATSSLQQMKSWVKRESGVTFTYQFETHICHRTHAELSWGYKPEVGAPADWRDEYGEGIFATTIFEGCFRDEMGLGSELPETNTHRWHALIIGAGGSYGCNTPNRCDPNGVDTANSWAGDWQARAYIEGVPVASCVAINKSSPEPVRSNHPCGGVRNSESHELGHALWKYTHAGDKLPDDTLLPYTSWPLMQPNPAEPTADHLTPGQKMALFQHSYRYLG